MTLIFRGVFLMNISKLLLFNLIIFNLISTSVLKSDCQNKLKHETGDRVLPISDSKLSNTETFKTSDLNKNSFIPIYNNINLNNSQMVYVTPKGKKYHKRRCGPGTYSLTSLNEAKIKGLTPCKRCFKQ